MGAAVCDGSGEVVVGELNEGGDSERRGANSGLPAPLSDEVARERVTNRAESDSLPGMRGIDTCASRLVVVIPPKLGPRKLQQMAEFETCSSMTVCTSFVI